MHIKQISDNQSHLAQPNSQANIGTNFGAENSFTAGTASNNVMGLAVGQHSSNDGVTSNANVEALKQN